MGLGVKYSEVFRIPFAVHARISHSSVCVCVYIYICVCVYVCISVTPEFIISDSSQPINQVRAVRGWNPAQ